MGYVEYKCPSCKRTVWVYWEWLKGTVCWECNGAGWKGAAEKVGGVVNGLLQGVFGYK